MGVDTNLFALKSQAGTSEVITPSHETLLKLRVVNDGRKPVRWTIESLSQGGLNLMYLKGEQETDKSTDKFMLVCPAGGPIFLYAIFDVGPNAEQVMRWPVNWLFLDDKLVRMDGELMKKEIKNGQMTLSYKLNPMLLNAISSAQTVGVGLQGGVGAAVYSGFNYMPFADGAAKLPGFMAVCQSNNK